MKAKTTAACAIITFLGLALGTRDASAQTKVFGSGLLRYSNGAPDGANSFRHVAVDAWLDEAGVANGWVAWQGDVFQELPMGNWEFVGGPADPWLIEVTEICFLDDRTAFVFGICVNSPNHEIDEGNLAGFLFTDNSGTSEPDMIDSSPIDAGNFTVR